MPDRTSTTRRQETHVDLICDNCGNEYTRRQSEVAGQEHTYCCNACRAEAEYVHPNLIMSEDLAYILGVSVGDGCVSSGKSIILSVVDKLFAESFKQSLANIGFRPTIHRYTVEQLMKSRPNHSVQSKQDCYRVVGCSASFTYWYDSLTLADFEAMLVSAPLKVAFLRGFYESDGHCKIDGKELGMSNTDKDVMLLAQRLTESLGFHFYFNDYEQQGGWKRMYRLSIHTQPTIGHFLSVIQPCIKNQHSHYNPNQLELNL